MPTQQVAGKGKGGLKGQAPQSLILSEKTSEAGI